MKFKQFRLYITSVFLSLVLLLTSIPITVGADIVSDTTTEPLSKEQEISFDGTAPAEEAQRGRPKGRPRFI